MQRSLKPNEPGRFCLLDMGRALCAGIDAETDFASEKEEKRW
jgi:hypothetical protein